MLDNFVYGLNLAVGLWVVWYREVFPNIEVFTKIYKMSIVELFIVVNDD